MKRVAVLSYHKIGPPAPGGWETWFYIPEAVFANQLAALHDGGWQPVDLAAFLQGLTEPERLPERTAFITFDDGYRSVRELALPWLAEEKPQQEQYDADTKYIEKRLGELAQERATEP